MTAAAEGFEVFLHENFAVEEYARKLLEENASIPEQLALLANNVLTLDKQLKEQITVHYEQLLSQATNIESLEDILSTLTNHVTTLQCSVGRACDKVSELYRKTEIRTKQLSRLHETCSLLRNVIRVQQLSSRLHAKDSQAKMAFSNDLVKNSQVVQELRDISSSEPGLKCLQVVDKELSSVQKMVGEILTSARSALKQGAKNQHQAQVGSALQAFFNLKNLRPQLDGYSKELGNEAKQILKNFDAFSFRDEATKSGDITTPQLTQSIDGQPMAADRSSVTARTNAWNDIGRLAEFLTSVCAQLQVLHVVASKKRQPDSHRFLEDAIGGVEFYTSVWTQIVAQIDFSLSNANSLIRQTLEAEYPRVLRYMSNVFVKLGQLKSILPEGGSQLRSALQGLETSYLSKSLARLFDGVNLVFHQSSIAAQNSMVQQSSHYGPVASSDSALSKTNESRDWLSKPEIDSILRSIGDELNVSKFDVKLFEHTCKNVSKTLQIFGVKCEQLFCTDGDGSQIIGSMTAGQKRNVDVINGLNYVLCGMTSLLKSSGGADDPNISDACTVLSHLMTTALRPLFSAIQDALSAIILTMHQESYFSTDYSQKPSSQQCSLYVRELQDFMVRVWRDYLTSFECSDLIYSEASNAARKAAELFLVHASLVRPIDEQGKMRLIADFAQIELALSAFCRQSPPDDLGPFRQFFKPMRQLLAGGNFSTQFIGQSDQVLLPSCDLPASLIAQVLISASPNELKSPHVTAGWSVARYAEWYVSQQGELEKLQFLRGTLESYARMVQNEGKTEYVPLYPILLKLLENGFKQCGSEL